MTNRTRARDAAEAGHVGKAGEQAKPRQSGPPGYDGTPATGPVATAVLRDARAFAALEEEWDGLYGAAPMATPFQSWAWLYSWWEAYGGGGRGLRLVTVRAEDGTLVGVLPLMLDRGRLMFVGSGVSNRLDVLVAEGWEGAVAGAGTAVLRGLLGRRRVADLWQIGPSAAAWELYGRWDGPRASAWQAGRPVLHLEGGWEGLLAGTGQKFRGNARRALRRMEADGAAWASPGADGVGEAGEAREAREAREAGEAARRLVALHRESWEGRGIAAEHLSRGFEEHLVAAAERMAGWGLGTVPELRRGDEVLASHLVLVGRDSVEGFLGGAKGEAARRYSVDALFVSDLVERAEALGIGRVSLGRGQEPSKMKWGPRVVPNRRVILARNLAPFVPYTARALALSRARRYANSEDAPGWVKKAAARYRALRYGRKNSRG